VFVERHHEVSRRGKILKLVKNVEFHTSDERYLTDGRRTITFYNSKRELIDRIDAQPGAWVTRLEKGFHAPRIPTS